MLLGIIILKFEYTSFKCIDHMGILILVIPLVLPPIRHMDMPVEKILWTVFFNQCTKHLESLVRQIPPVIELIGGSMRYQNIKTTLPE